MQAFLIEFGNMLLRWLHVIAAIAWIGESFYFVMLDNGLKKPAEAEDARRGVAGEMWAVHGGGFYHNQKYATAPAKLPSPPKKKHTVGRSGGWSPPPEI